MVAAFAGELGALFNGSGAELFNAAILLTAVGMLTWHNTWMASHGRELAREVRAIGTAVAAGDRPLTALAVVVGVAVLREGSEVVLFLYGIFAAGGTSIADMVGGRRQRTWLGRTCPGQYAMDYLFLRPTGTSSERARDSARSSSASASGRSP